MAKRSCGDFFIISRKWLGVFLEIFRNQGSSQNFRGLRLDYKETEGPICKFSKIIDFWVYFSIENHGGLTPWLMDQRRARSMVDRPPWPATELDGARPSGRSRARLLAARWGKEGGSHGDSTSPSTEAWKAARRQRTGGGTLA
jgi:hypothetical protein